MSGKGSAPLFFTIKIFGMFDNKAILPLARAVDKFFKEHEVERAFLSYRFRQAGGKAISPFKGRLATLHLSKSGFLSGRVGVNLGEKAQGMLPLHFENSAAAAVRAGVETQISTRGPQPGQSVHDVCLDIVVSVSTDSKHPGLLVRGAYLIGDDRFSVEPRLNVMGSSDFVLSASSGKSEVNEFGMTVASFGGIEVRKITVFNCGAPVFKATISPVVPKQTFFGREFSRPEDLFRHLVTEASSGPVVWNNANVVPKLKAENALAVMSFLHKIYQNVSLGCGQKSLEIPAPYFDGEKFVELFYQQVFEAVKPKKTVVTVTIEQQQFEPVPAMQPSFDWANFMP